MSVEEFTKYLQSSINISEPKIMNKGRWKSLIEAVAGVLFGLI